jgi:hypothetical protein
MLYVITIPQGNIVAKGFEVDIIDAAIMSYFIQFVHSPRCQKKEHAGKTYFWLSYSALIGNMPLLPLSTKDAVYRRVKKLVECGLLEAHPDNKIAGRSFFAFGPRYDDYVGHEADGPTDINPEPSGYKSDDLRIKIRRPTDLNPMNIDKVYYK